MEISFESLRKVQMQEKGAALVELQEDFFKQCAGWLQEQKKQLEKSYSLEQARVYENSLKVLKEIVDKRTQKIFLKALNDFASGDRNLERLSGEEKRLYQELINLLSKHGGELLSSSEQVQEPVEKPVGSKVRLLADLQEFVGPDSKVYGPFKSGEVVELSGEVALLLLKRNAAEML